MFVVRQVWNFSSQRKKGKSCLLTEGKRGFFLHYFFLHKRVVKEMSIYDPWGVRTQRAKVEVGLIFNPSGKNSSAGLWEMKATVVFTTCPCTDTENLLFIHISFAFQESQNSKRMLSFTEVENCAHVQKAFPHFGSMAHDIHKRAKEALRKLKLKINLKTNWSSSNV